jgi:hypothetical protein
LFIFFILLLLNQYSRLNAGEQEHCEPIDGDVIEVNRKFANKQTSRMAFLLASPVVITMRSGELPELQNQSDPLVRLGFDPPRAQTVNLEFAPP